MIPAPLRSNRPWIAALAVLAIVFGVVAEARAGNPHTVRRGETLSQIAANHGRSVSELAVLNGISNVHLIRTGQVLVIDSDNLYTVRRGDTLSEIAARSGTTTARLLELNPDLSSAHRIFPGMQLRVDQVRSYDSLPGDIARSTTKTGYIPIFERWAAEYGVPVDLLMALAYSESNWRVDARPRDKNGNLLSSAYGIGQILSGTARWINTALIPGPTVSRYTADGNIQLTAAYLGWLIDQFGDERLGTGAYMQGIGSVKRNGLNRDAIEYIERIENRRRFFQ